MRVLGSVAVAFLATAGSAWAQNVCRPPDNSNEAKTLGILAVPLAYSGLGGPTRDKAGSFWFTLEGSYVPNVDSATSTPTFCRPGKEAENTNLVSAFPRPRVGVFLPWHLYLEGSWIPPVRIDDVETNLFGLALGWSYPVSGALRLTIRGHATLGEIRGAFTCPESALSDPASECFNAGAVSDDKYYPNLYGVDATLAWAPGSGALRPYVGGGYTNIRSEFQVQFTNRVGVTDDTRVIVDLNRGAVFGGLLWLPARWLRIGGEVYAVPADAVTGRLFVTAYLN